MLPVACTELFISLSLGKTAEKGQNSLFLCGGKWQILQRGQPVQNLPAIKTPEQKQAGDGIFADESRDTIKSKPKNQKGRADKTRRERVCPNAMINITEKERLLLQDLQDQEKMCVEKYQKNEAMANDPVLKELFGSLKQEEQQHYNSLGQVMNGSVPRVNTQDASGKAYKPRATYKGKKCDETAKKDDAFLCTDAISSEKYVSSAYDFDLFQFDNSDVRRLLNDIETEEQNHAEKIHKYKVANDMG